jgi:cytochrome c1
MRFVATAFAVALTGMAAQASQAAESALPPERHWSFDGVFGTYDRGALQRGFQVYIDVCSGCHGLSLVAFRDLQSIGFSEEQVQAIAASKPVIDGPNDEGEMFERPGRASDRIPSPFPNEQAARFNNGGAYPPDLSLMAKAREAGPDYIAGLLTGYVEPPADFPLLDGMSYNLYFPGHQIAMPPPLAELEDDAGNPITVEQQAVDVAHFLAWAAEPKLEQRKRTGVKVVLFLVVLTALLYAVKRKVWADVH